MTTTTNAAWWTIREKRERLQRSVCSGVVGALRLPSAARSLRVEPYRCPVGKPLRSEWRAFTQKRSRVTKANTIIYRSSQTDCATCPLKAKCCPNTAFRKTARRIHEAARDVARHIAKTSEYLVSRCERKKVGGCRS